MSTSRQRSTKTNRSARGRCTGGFTLVEMLCTLAITAVLVSGVLPMFNDLHARQVLMAQAALLETDLHLARAHAMLNSQTVRLAVQAVPGGTSCYLLHTGAADACRCEGGGRTRCDGDASVLRLAEQAGPTGITLAPLARSLAFDAGKGTVTPTATLRLIDREGRAVHQVINIMGRVRTCTPSAGFVGLRPC